MVLRYIFLVRSKHLAIRYYIAENTVHQYDITVRLDDSIVCFDGIIVLYDVNTVHFDGNTVQHELPIIFFYGNTVRS